MPQPGSYFGPKKAWLGIRFATQLLVQAPLRDQRDSDAAELDRPASPDQPHVKIKHAGCVGESCDDISLNRNRVRTDLGIKRFAEGYLVIKAVVAFGFGLLVRVEPEFHSIKELKARYVNEGCAIHSISRTEEDGRREDALKSVNHSTVMRSVLWQIEKLENLRGACKMNFTAFLLHGEGGDPDGNKTILAEGQAEVRMRCDIQEELAVMPRVAELDSRRAP